MLPINNIAGIEKQEEKKEGNHVIAFLLVKPSDDGAESYIKKFNYWHQRSKEYCSIYLLGYSKKFNEKYQDIEYVKGINNQIWEYSDECFSETCDELKERIKKWNYSGEPELIVLQNSSSVKPRSYLDFSNYVCIDVNYGISKGYIDSFARFMEHFIDACKREVSATSAISIIQKKKMSPRRIIEVTIDSIPKLPEPVSEILKDEVFFRTCKAKIK